MRAGYWMLIVIAAIYVALYFGIDAAMERAVEDLASKPAVMKLFSDPAAAKGQALYVLFGALFSVPLLVLTTGFLGMLGWTLLRSAGDVLKIPMWLSGSAILIGGAWLTYAAIDWWWPRLLLGLGILARAWLVLALG